MRAWLPGVLLVVVSLGCERESGNVARAAEPGMHNPAPGSSRFVGANFWDIGWEPPDNYFRAGVDLASVDNPFRTELLRELAPYRVLRFMDWNHSNRDPNPQAEWSTRKRRNVEQVSGPVAFEWQIALCNFAKKDCWISVPHQASDAYFAELAKLIHAQLDPKLRVYVEWSNEVWNGIFPQAKYAAAQGKRLGLPGEDPAAAFQVRQSLRLFAVFDEVFGKDSPRVVKVLAGQAAWTGPCERQLAALEDDDINPTAMRPDVYAIAPYVHGATLADLRKHVSTAGDWTKQHVACAKKMGVPLIGYEGGSDSYGAGIDGCRKIQHDPAMRELYVKYLDAIEAAGLRGPFMQYTHTGACWGLKERTGDPVAVSPKYQGLLDWLAKR